VQGDDFAAALHSWGVTINTSAMVFHKTIETETESDDEIERAKKMPHIFVLNKYGQHVMVKTLNSLDGVLVPVLPVTVEKKADVKAVSIIPIPQDIEIWGETNFSSDKMPERDDKDLSPPFYGGAVAEKGKSRLVVLGSYRFASDGIIDTVDPVIRDKYRYEVNRFPANGELFMNSVYWLTGQEDWIALGSGDSTVNRIKPMSSGLLAFWHFGVLIIGLPALVIVAGIIMFIKRRD
jgi:hypothetical protein